MAKTQDGMDGSYKISPRKGMAMGKISVTGSENFGTKSFEEHQGHMNHPDRNMGSNATSDSSRSIGPAIKHSGSMHPAQAAPKHGPMGIRGLGRPRG